MQTYTESNIHWDYCGLLPTLIAFAGPTVANVQESKSSETYYKATFEKSSPDYALTTLPDNDGNISVRIQVHAKIQNLDITNVEILHINSPKSTTSPSELPLLPELLSPSSTLLKNQALVQNIWGQKTLLRVSSTLTKALKSLWYSIIMDWYFRSKHLAAVQIRTKDISECKDFMYNPWLYLSQRSTNEFAAKLQMPLKSGILGELPCQHYIAWVVLVERLHTPTCTILSSSQH